MIATVIGNLPPAMYEQTSETYSQEGSAISAAVRAFLGNSEYLSGRLSALRELAELYSTSKTDAWDEDEAKRPTEAAYHNAINFARALPASWVPPVIDVDRDGEFTFEWLLDHRRRISVSVGEDAEVAYAWILDGEQSYGCETFEVRLPVGFSTQANRVLLEG
jgi:hypothetical protein